MNKVTLAVFFTLVASSFAHFEVTSPTSRGFTEDTNTQSPCGGYDTAGNYESKFAVDGDKIVYDILDGTGTVVINYSPASGSMAGMYMSAGATATVTATGSQSVDVDLSKVGIAKGDKLTLQVVYSSDDGQVYYQCADVTADSRIVVPLAILVAFLLLL